MAKASDEAVEHGISRRQVLQWMAAGGTAVAVGTKIGGFDLGDALRATTGPPYAPPASVLVARGDDGLLLTLTFTNLELRPRTGQRPLLAPKVAAADGLLTLGLGPQSLLEEAVFDQTANGTPAAPGNPVRSLLSGPSRIVVKIPTGGVPFELPTILNLANFPLSVSGIADPGKADGLGVQPTPSQTSIEAPFRLFLSPKSTARFASQVTPVGTNKRTELWHARAIDPGTPGGGTVEVRAVFSPDQPPGTPLTTPAWAVGPNTVSLTPTDRSDIVFRTLRNEPAEARLLLLSPMGASLDIDGRWPLQDGLIAWRHRSWLGRDNYVKVERRGFLWPLGIRAVQVEITERIVNAGQAHLSKRRYIVVREPTIEYLVDPDQPATNPPGIANEGRRFPFVRATTTTLVTPPLTATPESCGPGAEWVQVARTGGNEDVRFQLQLESHEGRVVDADLPLVFVLAGSNPDDASNPAYQQAVTGPISAAYNASSESARRTLRLGGQRVALVPRQAGGTEDPATPTFDLVIDSYVPTANVSAACIAQRRLNGYPSMVNAQVRVEQLDAVSPTPGVPTTIKHHQTYLDSGFPAASGVNIAAAHPNAGEVWAAIDTSKVPSLPGVAIPQETGGGLAAPSFATEGLSLVHGPVSDLAKVTEGKFDPTKYFEDAKITLLGGIPLNAVLAKIDDAIPNPRAPEGEGVPRIVTKRVGEIATTDITFQPKLQVFDVDLIRFEPSTTAPHDRLRLQSQFVTNLSTQEVSSTVTGDLRNFSVLFAGTINQEIKRLKFESKNGGKPSLDVQLGKSSFEGDLRFLAELQDKLPALPGGVKIDVSPAGIQANLSIALPTVGLGVVLVQNISINVGLNIPFNGDQAILTFAFCTRENPFHCTIMALGGGGFLGIGIGMRGIQYVEGALEVGAAVALDFGVASGSVSIMAGIYFKFAQKQLDSGANAGEVTGNSVVITGYVRALGELDVLGIIHASIELYLGLSFKKDTINGVAQEGIVEGVARVTIKVEVLFLSKDVSIEMRKEFGSGVDPSFGDQISAADWSEYCAAFAA